MRRIAKSTLLLQCVAWYPLLDWEGAVMAKKKCTGCGVKKTETEFFWRSKAKGIRQARCKDCYRAWRAENYADHYERYRDEYKVRAKKRNARVRTENMQKSVAYLKTHPCVSCGESDFVVLDFDHRDQSKKTASVSRMRQDVYSWERIKAEIAKCDVLCANCHRRRTAKQLGWYKHVEVGMV